LTFFVYWPEAVCQCSRLRACVHSCAKRHALRSRDYGKSQDLARQADLDWLRQLQQGKVSDDVEAVFAPQRKSNRKIDNEDLRRAVFSLIHEPPSNYGQIRTSWTMSLLSAVLKQKGKPIGPALIRKMLKAEGCNWRKAKKVLTSTDPNYSEKLARIHSILANLGDDEAFISIDEFGPFAVKTRSGRRLTPPGTLPTIPQWQKSRGCLIVTGALELSRNKVTHFYSAKKNTTEMISAVAACCARASANSRLSSSAD